MVKLKLENMLEDAKKAGKRGLYTAGFAALLFGCRWIDDQYLGSGVGYGNFSQEARLLYPQIAVTIIQTASWFGSVMGGSLFAYSTISIPAKFLCGKYFERKKVSKTSLSE